MYLCCTDAHEARMNTKVNEQQHSLINQGKQLPESKDCAIQNLVLRLRGGGAPTSLHVSTGTRQRMPSAVIVPLHIGPCV